MINPAAGNDAALRRRLIGSITYAKHAGTYAKHAGSASVPGQRSRPALVTPGAAAAGAGAAGWERELEARGVLYEGEDHPRRQGDRLPGQPPRLDRRRQPAGVAQSVPGRPGTVVEPGRARAGQRPTGPGPARHRAASDDAARRDANPASRPTAPQLAHQAFAMPSKPPVVTRGDTDELLHALLIRLRQWRWDDRQHQQQRRSR